MKLELVIEVPGDLGCNEDTLQAAAAKVGKYRVQQVVGP